MNTKLYHELSTKSDNVLRKEFESGEFALITLKEMLGQGYLTQERYNRITRNYEELG